MKRILISLAALAAAAFVNVTAQATDWQAGRHYTAIPPQRTNVPAGKVEVMEVFSYGCPACNHFRAEMKRIQKGLPANAQLVYLPASWNAAENWPAFQRAYLTAQALGVADRAHEAMYDAIWSSDDLAVVDRATGRLKRQLPSMETIAAFYQRVTGVKAADFVAASKSFGVDLKARQADAQIKAMQITGTPTLVVAGKYRINSQAIGPGDDQLELIKFLVAKETAAKKP